MTMARQSSNRIMRCLPVILLLVFASHAYAIDLSSEEKDYLRSKVAIVFVSQTRYPPFEFTDTNRQHEGMMLDVVRWMAVEMGFQPVFEDMTFQQAQEAVLSGKADILTSLFYSDKRKESFEFTETLFDVPASIFVRAERTDIKDLRDLSGKTIAIQRGDYAKDFLESNNISFDTLDTKDFAEATNMVIAGNADAVIGDEQIVLYHIFSNRLTDYVKKMGEPLYIGKNCMAANKSNAILIGILNKGIHEARKSGVLDKVSKKWLGTKYGFQESFLDRFILPLSAGGGCLLLLSLAVWVWNVKLRALVRIKTEAAVRREEALRESEERFKLSMEATKDGLWDWNIKTGECYFSPAYYLMLGYEVGAFPHGGKAWKALIHPDDLEQALQASMDCIEGRRELFEAEYRMIARNGEWRWILDRGKCITRDEQDRALRLVGTHVDITERKRAETALQQSERNYRAIFNSANDAIFIHDTDTGAILDVNDTMLHLYGFSYEEALRLSPDVSSLGVSPYSAVEAQQWLEEAVAEGPQVFEWHARKKSGDLFWVEVALKSADISGQRRVLAVVRDITERKKGEEEREKLHAQLTQAKKMESIGRLAGGVAHDFNNMLGIILGHVEMALCRSGPSHPLVSDLLEIQKAAERSADLTRQLLAFARKQPIAPKVLDLNETVEKMLKMLRRLIGEDIDLAWLPGSGTWQVKMDPSQIDQVLANMCVNSRDAIAGVGKLTIETGNAAFDEAYCAEHVGYAPGEYVLLAVSDDGRGMDKETQDKLFEPFFTTKELGEGIGLGLATVYGIVKQNNGFIDVYSELDNGTSFKIYLPRHKGKAEQTPNSGPYPYQIERGHETILLVEDEPAILKMTAMMLEHQGYTVLTASTPTEAIRLAETHPDKIDLLMTDVVMPEMNGRELVLNLLALYPDLKHLFMSGYTADVIAHHGVLAPGVNFIQKPFSVGRLAAKLREALGEDVE